MIVQKMPTSEARIKRSARARSRFGYDENWWGASAAIHPESHGAYWNSTKQPFPCLIFVLPLLIVYEMGVARGAGSEEICRTGADLWMRQALGRIELTDRWLPPLTLVAGLLGWQAITAGRWRFRPVYLVGMAVESLVLAVGLIGGGRLVEIGFNHLDTHPLLQMSPLTRQVIGFLGAGVYEESLFRLTLLPLIYYAARLVMTPKVLAGTVAVTGSSLLFSLAHHAGMPGESFTLFAFIFRWLAGIFFAWVFLTRGFGVAVGTHAAYDILVGSVGLHF